MFDAIETFQLAIKDAQASFRSGKGQVTDQEVFRLKDSAFDAIVSLSNSALFAEDEDLRQLLASTAIRIHLHPVGQTGWKEDLIDQISSAISVTFQVIAFSTIEADEQIAIAA